MSDREFTHPSQLAVSVGIQGVRKLLQVKLRHMLGDMLMMIVYDLHQENKSPEYLSAQAAWGGSWVDPDPPAECPGSSCQEGCSI